MNGLIVNLRRKDSPFALYKGKVKNLKKDYL